VVHHSSEEYNLTTALRQTSGGFFTFVFFLPLAVLGIEPYVLITVGSVNLVYQFWVHTRHIKTLGFAEWFLVTPSNHRVHHAQNALYLDKNYGGVFIVWDRLFGTFQAESSEETPIYGVRKALKSWNPIWANLQVYSQLFKDAWHTQKFSDKLRIWFMPTGWRPNDVAVKYPLQSTDLANFEKFDITLSLKAKIYAILQHSVAIALALLVLLEVQVYPSIHPLIIQFGLITLVFFSAYSLGAYLENKSHAGATEVFKNVFVCSILLLSGLDIILVSVVIFVCFVSLILMPRNNQI
jgi:hypothetical protein